MREKNYSWLKFEERLLWIKYVLQVCKLRLSQ